MNTKKKQTTNEIIMAAPMDGYTDLAFRKALATNATYRPDRMFTEFVNVEAIIRDIYSAERILKHEKLSIPTSAQLFGKNPTSFAQAIPKVLDLGYSGIDINMGCGARKIVTNGEGAGLIENYDLCKQIIEGSSEAINKWIKENDHEQSSIKFSVKTRLGINSNIGVEWTKFLDQFKLDFITIHGRTYKQGYSGSSNWDRIAQIANLVSTPIIGNGDITNITDAQEKLRKHNLYGVMIGRNYRSFFADINEKTPHRTRQKPKPGSDSDPLTFNSVRKTMLDYLTFHENLMAEYFKSSEIAFISTRKVLLGFMKGCKNTKSIKNQLMKAESYAKAKLMLAMRFKDQ
ncbi:hypothetical protein GF357_01690 [Candidatus Dojkabacteria bacterium]|nr:hypothetical protein [Candidatus Dojkabacteria bacterium]